MYANSRKPYAFGNVGAEQYVSEIIICIYLVMIGNRMQINRNIFFKETSTFSSKCYSHLKKNGLCLPNALMVDIRVGGVASQVRSSAFSRVFILVSVNENRIE